MPKNILILDFKNLSQAKKDNYLSHSIPIEITHLLSQYKNLRIISTKSKTLIKSEFGKDITIDFFLEGSFLRTKNLIRFNFQLVNGHDATCVLSIKLEEHTDNIFQLIDSVASKVVHYLELEFTTNKHTPEISPKAYTYYLKGIQHWDSWNETSVKSAIAHFKKVIELEPEFPLAYVRLSHCFSFLAAIVTKNSLKNYKAAKAAAIKAIALDNTSIEAHLSLALIKLVNDIDILGAYYSFESAFAIDNSYTKAHHYYAYYLITIGKYQKAIEALDFVLKADPVNLQANSTYGFALLLHNKHQKAESHLKKTLATHPNSEATYDALIWTYILSKQYHKAKALVENSKMDLVLSPVIEIIVYNALGEWDKFEFWKNKLEILIENDTDGKYSKEASAVYFALDDTKNGTAQFELFYKNKMGFIRALSHPAWKAFRESNKFYIYKKRLKLLKPPILPPKLTENTDDVIVVHSTTSEIFAMASSQLLFIESQGVYCKVVYLNDAKKVQEKILRTSLTKIMNNTFYLHFYRCHNSFIINTNILYTITGNKKNTKLYLKDYAIEIPVSRHKVSNVLELFPSA
ncbi:LytTR family transcriptional regulator DNA-binding domain-containing protein [Flavivirga algicola]|uniref:HTH LytTR-type domain-containing protein n=1 Tax=Flavivirga algicola TaxID=2729136 RepID=A0ABX1RVE5_9FLAO|nr:tetratricopeptide repeat protein [Flavivirga algicola]NMH87526.1 hypothetical protein [Flavivirga algicola]